MAGGEDDLRWKTIETWGGLPSGIRCDRGDPLFPRLEALPAAAPVSGPATAPPGPAVAAPGSAEEKKGKSIPGPAAEITYDEFARIDLRAALVEHAERVPKSDKLLKLSVRVGEETRQIVAGIGQAYAPEQLIGRKVIIVANLKPAKLMGLESCGMVLAAGPGGADLAIAGFDREVAPGTRVK
ncbi:MAG: Methionine--tRNA ligase [Myxococcota bacterium]|nr:Methionine--tRNA ligase [Myxococcota bacterium]